MIKITIISNNHVHKKLKEEHGFSLLLKAGKYNILIDTGQSKAFLENIEILKIDIKLIQALIISHGHYDHCGNISFILNKHKNIKTYIHPAALKKRYSIHKDRNPEVKEIGLSPESIKSLSQSDIVLSKEYCKIIDNIFITGQIPRISSEDQQGHFYYDLKGLEPDTIPDDQSIWIETKEGLIIITGCCHAGLVNTVEYIKKVSGLNKVKAIIGGLHLNSVSPEKINNIINYINSLKLEKIYPGHCTGDDVIKMFKYKLNCSVIELLGGDEITLSC